jgi:predicted RNA binding protein YcfA (HicA-like mRNA interferase family)
VKLPRDISGSELAQLLARLGYTVNHQTGSHIRLTTTIKGGEHHVTVPAHNPLKVGTLSAILRSVAEHHALSREELLRKLFD